MKKVMHHNEQFKVTKALGNVIWQVFHKSKPHGRVKIFCQISVNKVLLKIILQTGLKCTSWV